MPSHRPNNLVPPRRGREQRPLRERALLVLWPSFVMAGVLEALVFVVVDPLSLQWFGGEPLGWSANAVYSVTFFIFWAVITAAGLITEILAEPWR